MPVSQAGATNNQLVWVTQHSCTILNKGRTMKAVVLLVAMFHGGSADLTGERQGDVCGEEAPQTNVDVSLLQSRKSFQLSNKKSLLVEDDASVHSCVQQKFAQIVRETRTPARAVLRVERAGSVLYEETADSSGSTRPVQSFAWSEQAVYCTRRRRTVQDPRGPEQLVSRSCPSRSRSLAA